MSRPIWTLDAETDPFLKNREPHPFVWDVYDGTRHHIFRRVHEVATFLRDKRVIVYAHNGGRFDYMARDCRCYFKFADGICRGGPECRSLLHYLEPCDEVTIINGRVAKFRIGVCELRDSWNILPVPLAKFGDKKEIDYALMERGVRERPENWRTIIDYLQQDCVALYDAVTRYVSEFGLNLTQAGGALKFWSKLTEQDPPRSTREFYDRFSIYYYGGRVQCFKKGVVKTRFKVADINSAYPRAMLEPHAFSTDEPAILTGTALRGAGLTPQGFYDVTGVSRGAFPYRNPDTGKLDFPNDDVPRLYHITGWELRAAIELNLLRDFSIDKAVIFSRNESFQHYIRHCYDERQKAKKAGDSKGDILWKLLMNSLYGKWGSHPSEYREYHIYEAHLASVIDEQEPDEFGRKETCAGRLGPWALGAKELLPTRQNYYNVATSASITGYVRAYLLRSMRQCKGLLYCDTDSIAAEDVSGLPQSDKLGDWKIEGHFKRAAIAGRKLYAFEYTEPQEGDDGEPESWKVRSKGSRLDADEILAIASGGEIEWTPDSPTFSAFHAPRFTPRNIRMT